MTDRRVAVLSLHTSPLAQPGTGDGGGLNVYVLETARRLAARGVTVDVFTRASTPSAPPTVAVAPRLSIHHVAAGSPHPVPKAHLPELVESFALGVAAHPTSGSHDVIHSHYWLSGWAGRWLRRRWDVPLVHTFHTLGIVKNETMAPGDTLEPVVRLRAEARLAMESDRLVVSACDEARLMHRRFGVSGARVDVVRPGVDPTVFHPGARRTRNLTSPLLLFVGRLQPLKGPDVALRTFAHVRAQVPGARLLIVGGTSGDDRLGPLALMALAADLGVADAVSIVAPRPQRILADVYRMADVLLVPSRSETFGLVALESQASGTPVVAADVGGLRTAVGPGGILVAGHEPADHAAAVVSLLADPRQHEATSASGALHALQWTWDRTVDSLLEVYRDLAERPALRGAV